MPWEAYRDESPVATLPPTEPAVAGPWTDFAGPTTPPEPETDSWAEVVGKSVMQGLTFVPLSLGALMRFNDELLGRAPAPDNLYDIAKDAQNFWEPQTGRSAPKRHTANILRTVSEMGSTLAVTGGAGLLPGVSVGAGAQKYAEARDEGATVGRAAAAGTVQGGIEAATELIPLGILLKPGLTFGRRLAMGMITDLPGELIATASEMAVVDSLILGKHYTTDQYIEALKDTAIVSLGVTGLMTAGTHPLIKAIEQAQDDMKQAEGEVAGQQEQPVQAPSEPARTVAEPGPQADIMETAEDATPEESALVDLVIEGTDLKTAAVTQAERATIPPLDSGPTMQFPLASDQVSGLVVRESVPNQDAIEASLPDYEILPGIREVRLSDFTGAPDVTKKSRSLAEQIRASGEITPLIVVQDKDGLYVLEGANRWDALHELGVQSFPAMVVLDVESLSGIASNPESTVVSEPAPSDTTPPPLIESQPEPTEDVSAPDVGRMVSEPTYQAARARLSEKLGSLHGGIDPTILSDLVITGAYHIENGVRTFKAWSSLMIETYGQKVQPHLKAIWKQSRDYLSARVLDRNTKRRVRETTGQVSIAKMIREDQALAAAWLKAEQSARIAFREGNKAGVAKEKARMVDLIHQAKARAADRAKLPRDIKALKTLRDKAEGTIALDYQQKISDLLGQVDFAKPTDETIERLRGLREFLDREGVPLGISQAELAQLGRLSQTPIRELSGTARAELMKTAKKLYDLGKLKQTLKTNQRLREQAAALDRLVASTVNLDPSVSGQKNPTKTDIYKVGASRLSLDVLHTFRVADLADGVKDYAGEHSRMIKQQMQAETTAKNEAARRMRWVLEKLSAQGITELTPEMSQRIAVVLMVEQGARGQAQTLMDIHGMTAVPVLTASERQVVEMLRTEAAAKTDQIRAVYEQRENTPFQAVKKYFPIKYESDFNIAPAETINQDRYRTKESEQGFTVERVPGVKKIPRVDVLAVLDDAIRDQEWYLNLQPVLDQHAALVRTPEYRAAAGDLMWTWWKDQLDIVARKGWSATARANPVLRQVRLNLNQGILGYKLSTMMMQPFAVFDAMAYAVAQFGPRAGIDVVTQFTKAWINPPTALRFAKGSPALRLRQAGEIAIEETLQQAGGIGGLRQAITQGAFAGIKMADIITASGVEQGLLATLKRHGIPNAEQEADFLMNVTSGSAEVTARPHLLARGEGARTWLTFQSFFMNRWGIITHDLMRSGFRGNWKRKATAMLGLAILMVGGLAEDEAREKLIELTTGKNSTISDEALLKRLVLYVPRQIPAIGGVFEKWGRAEPPAIREVEQFGQGMQQILDGKLGKGSLKVLESVTALLIGVPGTAQFFDLLQRAEQAQPQQETR